tara:strand:- start:1873 stop:2577 length:705 start_codon:yes stop_codon:yes gene_type:complete
MRILLFLSFILILNACNKDPLQLLKECIFNGCSEIEYSPEDSIDSVDPIQYQTSTYSANEWDYVLGSNGGFVISGGKRLYFHSNNSSSTTVSFKNKIVNNYSLKFKIEIDNATSSNSKFSIILKNDSLKEIEVFFSFDGTDSHIESDIYDNSGSIISNLNHTVSGTNIVEIEIIKNSNYISLKNSSSGTVLDVQNRVSLSQDSFLSFEGSTGDTTSNSFWLLDLKLTADNLISY